MRRLFSALGVVVATTATLVALPVAARPAVRPHPVAASLVSLPLPMAATDSAPTVLADTGARSTRRFQLAGVAWRAGALPAGTHLELRTRTGGRWSSWSALDLPDGGPDAGSTDAIAAATHQVQATDPLWVGDADGAQARLVGTMAGPSVVPSDLHVVLVNGGTSGADATPGPPVTLGGSEASAAQNQPTVYTRAQWGANESLRSRNGSDCASPSYGSTVKMGFIHHTDTGNGYSSSSVPSIIRSIYAYHVESNGWCDIGYNFLVDRFGRIWEGRYGGISRAVIGAHTGGFNTNSFGASLIGNYTSSKPSSAMLTAVEQLFAWKLGSYYRDPLASTTMTAGSFSGSRYAAGSTVTFAEISGHRDADTTTCPGSAAYGDLPGIRTAVTSLIGAGLVSPSITPTSIPWGFGKTFNVSAGVLGAQTWTVTVTDSLGNVVKATPVTGASRGTPITGSWDGTDNTGLPVPPGTYTVSLSSQTASSTALPFATKVTITPPITVSGPSTASYGSTVQLTGTAPIGTDVTVNLQRGDVALPPQVVHTTSASWSTTFVADDDYTWSASVNGFSTSAHTTKVAPAVTTPAPTAGALFVPAGTTIQLAGTALPAAAATVHLVSTATGSSPVTGPDLPVGADGTWTGGSVTVATPTSLVVTDNRGVSSSPVTVYPVAAPTATAATQGYSQRTLTVSGNAGNAPVAVRLFGKAAGASAYTLAATVTAATSGAYTARLTLPAVNTSTPFGWKVSTGYGADVARSTTVLPAFAPTAVGPRVAHFGSAVALTGKAVPGDLVTILVRGVGGSTWSTATTATATTAGAWSATFRLLHDTQWTARTQSGTTAVGTVVVAPTLTGPRSAPRLSFITLSGTAVPGRQVVLTQRPRGTTTWQRVASTTAAATGRWSARVRLVHRASYQAVSNGRSSAVWAVTFA